MGEFGGKLAEDGGDSRKIYFFDWKRGVYNIYSNIYSASAEEKFLTGRGEYII